MSRSLPVADLPETFAAPGGRLRVLMVISRPAGTGDVGYRMIARPLLDRLEAVRGQVDLVVLRPPTLEALRRGACRGGAGRGAVPGGAFRWAWGPAGRTAGRAGRAAAVMMPGRAPEGVLVFEKPGGGPMTVPASPVAQVLKAAGCRWWC